MRDRYVRPVKYLVVCELIKRLIRTFVLFVIVKMPMTATMGEQPVGGAVDLVEQ